MRLPVSAIFHAGCGWMVPCFAITVREVQYDDVRGVEHLAEHFLIRSWDRWCRRFWSFFMSVFMVKEFPPCNIHPVLILFMIQNNVLS